MTDQQKKASLNLRIFKDDKNAAPNSDVGLQENSNQEQLTPLMIDPPLLRLMNTIQLNFKTLKDLDVIIFFCKELFKEQQKVITGIHALCLNAIEHGNCEIGYERKSELIAENRWSQEIEERMNKAPYNDRVAELVITKKDDGTYIIVNDQGPGFEWEKFIDMDPTRAGKEHGRGIAISKSLSFDKLTFNEKGNQAIGFIAQESELNW